MEFNMKQLTQTTEKLKGSLQGLFKNTGDTVTEELVQKGQELDGMLNEFIDMLKKK
ncbi:MAG: hypothetical protein Q7J85_00845 [Bacillota bacterium]|nr:hypothetical protein [Bacillota bacterium]